MSKILKIEIEVKHCHAMDCVTEGAGYSGGVYTFVELVLYIRMAFIIYRKSPLRGNFLSEKDLLISAFKTPNPSNVRKL